MKGSVTFIIIGGEIVTPLHHNLWAETADTGCHESVDPCLEREEDEGEDNVEIFKFLT